MISNVLFWSKMSLVNDEVKRIVNAEKEIPSNKLFAGHETVFTDRVTI